MRHIIMKIFAAFLAVIGLSQSVSLATAPLPRLVLGIDGVEHTRNLPALIAERLGYFHDEGLTVTLVDAVADPSPAQLMKDGRADGAVAFYHHTFRTQADGLPTQAVLVMGATPQLKLLVAKRLSDRVKKVSDLRGMKIFTGGVNSGKTTSMNWLAARAGFGPKDYTALPLAPRDKMATALRDGAADAIIAHEPDIDFYLKSGVATELADLYSVPGTKAALGDIYPSTTLFLPKAYIDAHPDVVQAAVNALVRALAYINGHSAEEIAAVLPARMIGSDRAAFLNLLAADKLAFMSDGRLSLNAARQQLSAMTSVSPHYASVKLDETYTNRFVDRAHKR